MRGFVELIRELVYYLAHNKRWWLAPIVVTLILLSLLMILITSPLGPLFYATF